MPEYEVTMVYKSAKVWHTYIVEAEDEQDVKRLDGLAVLERGWLWDEQLEYEGDPEVLYYSEREGDG